MRLIIAGLLFGVSSALCHGQVFLKPMGEESAPLHEKSVTVHTVLDRGLATTTLTMVFANQSQARIEADFIYTLQPGSQATAFAYWYGNEKVPAQIVERERAAEIYKHITVRQHDPALIEVIGKRTFRARIFPVMPNSDLKVEVQMVQPWSRGKTFELPIQLKKGELLKSMDLEVESKDPDHTSLLSNYPLQLVDGIYRYHAESYRPDQPLRVTYRFPERSVRAHLLAAPSGGPVGFFALNVTGPKFSPVSLQAKGITFSELLPKPFPKIEPRREAVITGRYTGSGKTELFLIDRLGNHLSLGTQNFSGTPEPNHSATKLWAADKLGSLSVTKNRDEMIRLSERFGIPSLATSWLAIPEEERQRYAREKAEADLEIMVRNYVSLAADGKVDHALHSKIEATATKQGIYWKYIESENVWELGRRYANEFGIESVAGRVSGLKAKQNLLRIQRLAKLSGYPNLLRDCLENTPEVHRIADAIAEDILKNNTGPSANYRRKMLHKWSQLSSFSEKDFLRQHLSGWLYQLDNLIVRMRYAAATDPEGHTLEQLEVQRHRIEPYAEDKPGETYQMEYHQFFDNLVGNRFGVAQQKVAQFGPNSPEAMEALHMYFDQANAAHYTKTDRARAAINRYSLWNDIYQLGNDIAYGIDTPEHPSTVRWKLNQFEKLYDLDLSEQVDRDISNQGSQKAGEYVAAKLAIRQSQFQFDELKNQLNRLAKAGHFNPDQKIKEAFDQTLSDPRTKARYEYIEAKRNPNTPKVELLTKRRTLFALDNQRMRWYPDWASRHLDRIDVQVELDRLEHMPRTPDVELRIKAMKIRDNELRGSWGDPLITSDAPHDAKMVVAKLPDGTIKHLEWNEPNQRWECRFEIPSTAHEGRYKVEVVSILADYARKVENFTYVVDNTPPKGKITLAVEGDRLRILVECSEDVARAEAILPDGSTVSLAKVALGKFVETVKLPSNIPIQVKAVLIDKAHNLREISCSLNSLR